MTGTSMIPSPAEKANLQDLAQGMVESGFFKDTKSVAQAFVKVQAGREMGLGPVEAMRSFHIVEGKVEMTADLLAQLVKKSEKYDYRIRDLSNTLCTIEFMERVDLGGGEYGDIENIGVSSFSMEDAKQAGLAGRDVWKKYPRNMLFARAMSNGVAFFAPDAVGTARIYVDGEISGEETAPTGDNNEPASSPDSSTIEVVTVDTTTGEIVEAEVVGGSDDEQSPGLDDSSAGEAPPTTIVEVGAVAVGEKTDARESADFDTVEAGGEDTEPISVEVDSSSSESEPPASAPVGDTTEVEVKLATAGQKQKLAIMAQRFGWDDDQRHAEAGVESFTKLERERASELIEDWGKRLEHDHAWKVSPVKATLAICMVEGCTVAEPISKIPGAVPIAPADPK